MFVYVLYGLFIFACIVLVIAVLLQPGKSDAGALFASSVSSTAFGPRGTATLLAKITIGAAAVFMLVALTLSLPALTGKRSVVENTSTEATPTPQASPPAAPAPPVTAPPTEVASPAASTPADTTSTSANPAAKADVLVPPATSANAKASPGATKQ